MPKNGKKNRTRVDYLVNEVYGPIYEQMDDSQFDEEWAKEFAKGHVTTEDERIWAWSRDPISDLTQIEARNRAQNHDYGRYNLSQSSVSRKLSQLDETMFTEPVEYLGMEEPLHSEEWYDTEGTCKELMELHRQTLARYICDLEALKVLGSGECPTPRWVEDRFPGVDPNLGLKVAKRAGIYDDWDTELHDPQDWGAKQPAAADD